MSYDFKEQFFFFGNKFQRTIRLFACQFKKKKLVFDRPSTSTSRCHTSPLPSFSFAYFFAYFYFSCFCHFTVSSESRWVGWLLCLAVTGPVLRVSSSNFYKLSIILPNESFLFQSFWVFFQFVLICLLYIFRKLFRRKSKF